MKIEVTPYRDWRIVAFAFFAGIFASFGFNTYLFMGINEDNFFGKTIKGEEGIRFDKEKLSAVLELFKEKETAFEALKQAPASLVDPSL